LLRLEGIFMKNLKKLFGIISIIAMIACAMAACDSVIPTPDQPQPQPQPQTNQTPVAGDYEVGNLAQSVGSVTAVTITPKSGKSPGAVNNIKYAGKAALPTAAGTYAVTFDVAAATGWYAAADLSAGNLIIGTPTPVADDYEISGLWQTFGGTIVAVTITPKAGKSPGAVSNVKYAGNAALPTAKGTYAITFDVAAATGWNKADGLSAGNLEINDNQTPKADDYNIGNLAQSVGSVTAVTITPKSGKSTGKITIYYEGASGTSYAKSTTLPTAATVAGTYAVTFDVAAATGWNPATGLAAGDLALSATQAQTLAVTIIGTPGVGKRLTADVQKNFSGKNEYQWKCDGKNLDGEDWFEFTPNPAHVGKKISVEVKCGTVMPATSTAVTIPAITFTVEAGRWESMLYVYVKIGDYTWEPSRENGFTIQWLRNGTPIPGATNQEYNLTADDVGKTVKVEIKGHGQTKHSDEFQIGPLAPVQPVINIEYRDYTTRSSDEIWAVMEEIEFAYNENLANCKDMIDGTGKPLFIDLCEPKAAGKAEIGADGKLHIWFSMILYDEFEDDRADRLDQIGERLRFHVVQMLGLEDENTDELEGERSIHRGKLAKSQPKARVDHA
jgi:hypothetical protein